ncbi:MAG: hypothetical protein QQN41_06470 [Nitrosopumilus sp.]
MDKIKWKTVTYTIVELKPVGGVVIQRDVLEKYKAEHLDEEVKTFAGFKCNQQDKTVSLRIGIVDDSIAADSGIVAKIEGEEVGKSYLKLKEQLLELQYRHDNLIDAVSRNAQKFSDLLVENDKLQRESGTVIKLYDNVRKELAETQNIYHELRNERDELGAKIEKIIQRLKSDYFITPTFLTFEDLFSEMDHTTAYNLGIDTATLICSKILVDDDYYSKPFSPEAIATEVMKNFPEAKIEKAEDSADLAEAKKAIVEDDAISLDEVEDAVENQEPVTDGVNMTEQELNEDYIAGDDA